MASSLEQLAEKYGPSMNYVGADLTARITSSDGENPAEGLDEAAVGHLTDLMMEDLEGRIEDTDMEIIFREESTTFDADEWVVVA